MSYKVTDTTVVDQNRNINNIGIATFVGPILIGSGSSTGTPSQALQLIGTNGAYIGGSLGIGTTSPSSKLSIVGDGLVTGIITGSVLVASKDPGTGIATDSTNTVFGNGWRLNNPASTTYYKLATLPIGSSGNTFDHLNINGVLGAWTNANQTPFEIFFSNRGAFNYKYTSYGSIRNDVKILGISTNSTVEIWAQHQASAFTKLTYNILNSLQSLVVTNPVSTTTAPVGTTVFDSSTATPRFIINESDNVGVGTTNAPEKLSVFGKIQIQQDSSSNNRFILRGQPGSLFRWNIDNFGSANDFRIFREDDTTAANGVVYLGISTGGTVTATKFSGDGSLLTNVVATSGAISISTNTTNQNQYLTYSTSFGSTTGLGATSLLLYNPSTGNIGIGSTIPNSKLSIVGDAIVSGIITANSFRARGGAPGALGVNNNGYGFFGPGDNDSGMYSSADGQVEFYSNSVEIARIAASGNIGVGTTNPTSKLHVEGSALITGVGTIATLNSTVATLTNLGGTNVNYTGVGTIATLNSTVATLTNLGGTNVNYTGIGTIANLGGTNVNYTGVGTIATFNATRSTITNETGTNLNFTGIGTIATLNSTVATLTNLGGTNVNYSGIGTIATFNATTSTITNETGTNLNFSGIGTITNLGGTNINYTGIGTIATLNSTVASLTNLGGTNINYTGIGTIATLNSTVASLTNLGGTNVNYTGVGTIATLNSTVATLTNLGGTNVNYSGIGTIATFNATRSTITNETGTNLNFSGIGTVANLVGTNINYTGIITAASFSGSGANLTSLNASNLSTGTVPAARITASSGDFTVGNNLYVAGTLSVGGTSVILSAATLVINDRDIVVGYTTDVNGNDVSSDVTANHGGISVASTVGSPLISIPQQTGINSNPASYKQWMWIRSGNYSGLGTDAWVSNYAVSIANTASVQLNSRLTVGVGFTVYDTYLDAQGLRATSLNSPSANISGIGTIVNLGGTNVNYTGVGTIATLNSTVATLTNLGGTNVNYSGIGTIATLNSTVATLTNLGGTNINYTGVGTVANLGGTNINYSGIGTIATLNSTVASLTNLGGTNVNYTGIGTIATLNSTVATLTNLGGTNINFSGVGTIATFNATTSTITNENGTNLNFSGIGTVTTLRGTNINYTGIGTIASFNATTSTITNETGTNLNFSGIGTVTNLVGTNINYTGIITAASFSGSGANLTGVVANSTVSTSSTTATQYIGFVTVTSGVSTSIAVNTSLSFIPSSGNLGVGTTNPTSKLHVVGNTLISGVATVTSDFTVNSGTLDVDAVNNRVGVGTLTQSFLLDVNGDTRIQGSNRMRFGGNVGTTNFYIQYNSTTNSLDFVAG